MANSWPGLTPRLRLISRHASSLPLRRLALIAGVFPPFQVCSFGARRYGRTLLIGNGY